MLARPVARAASQSSTCYFPPHFSPVPSLSFSSSSPSPRIRLSRTFKTLSVRLSNQARRSTSGLSTCSSRSFVRLTSLTTAATISRMSANALTPRRLYSTPSKEKESDRNGVPEEHHHPSQENGQNKHTHDHHEHHHHNSNHDHEHTHSHSIFGSLTHTHIPGENGHSPDAEKIVEALKGGGMYYFI